jgi:hypothetical protein
MSSGKFPPIYDWSDMPKLWPEGKKEEKDGDPVHEEAMFREVAKLINDGWKANADAATHVREITVIKE